MLNMSALVDFILAGHDVTLWSHLDLWGGGARGGSGLGSGKSWDLPAKDYPPIHGGDGTGSGRGECWGLVELGKGGFGIGSATGEGSGGPGINTTPADLVLKYVLVASTPRHGCLVLPEPDFVL